MANIEALWAARNLKLYPVALKNAIIHDKRLQLAAETATVYIPRLNMQTKLADTENWDLLNLDVDEVCSLAESVAKAADVPMKTLSSVLDDYSQTSLGMAHFLNMNQINCPVFFSPATNHYSWPKAATLLGMGYASLIQVAVDSDGRQDLRGQLFLFLASCRRIIHFEDILMHQRASKRRIHNILFARDKRFFNISREEKEFRGFFIHEI